MEHNSSKVENQSQAPGSAGSTKHDTKQEANCYSQETIRLLSSGLVNLYKPNLVKVKEQLTELTFSRTKQTVLIEQLHDENLKLSWAQNSKELQEMFNTVRLYQGKLLNIKKEMRSLHDRSTKLKKRAGRLQQYREREIYLKNEQIKQEQDLIAKPSSSGSM